MNKTTYAAATLTVLTALAGAGVLVHGNTWVTGQDETGVTSPTAPRTVVMAEPAEPLCPELLARCAPIPPEPVGLTAEERQATADVYTRAWEEVTR